MHEKAKFVCFNYMQPQKVKFKSVQINMKQVSYFIRMILMKYHAVFEFFEKASSLLQIVGGALCVNLPMTPKNSEDPDELPHFIRVYTVCNYKNNPREIQFYLDIITCYPSVYAMDHSKVIVSNQMVEFICA